jgi:hypothetical protein
LLRQTRSIAIRSQPLFEEDVMGDLLWIAIIAGLAAATLAYIRLCDNA